MSCPLRSLTVLLPDKSRGPCGHEARLVRTRATDAPPEGRLHGATESETSLSNTNYQTICHAFRSKSLSLPPVCPAVCEKHGGCG